MSTVDRTGRHRRGRRRVILGAVALVVVVPVVSVLTESLAAAATPNLVQDTSGSNSNSSPGSPVSLTASLPSPCNSGDTLIAFITIGQQASAGGMVSVTPPGWQRLYEHSPTDTSPYQGWFALSDCSSSTQSATFTVTAPNDSSGTSGSIVLSEYSGLPDPIAVDFATNDGSSSSTTADTLSGESPSSSGELTLTALSFYSSSTPSSTTPTPGWSPAGSVPSSPLPAYSSWKVGTSSAPSASFGWSPAAPFEVTMLALEAGPAGGAPGVVQEDQGAFSGQSSWGVSLPSGVATGDALVALIGTNASGSTGSGYEASSINGGNVTWQQVTGYRQSGTGSAEVWVGFASTGTSGSTTVTASLNGSVSGNMVVAEVSGIAEPDAQNSGSGTTAPSITPHAGDFLVGFLTTTGAVEVHPQPNWSTFSLAASNYAGEWQSNVPHSSTSPSWTTTGGSSIAAQAAFRATASVPTVTGVSPAAGPLTGGTSVTITGTNFTTGASVSFGGTAATGVSVVSSTSITATSPSSSARTVDVTVTVSGTTSPAGVQDEFSYVGQPTVTGVSPGSGSYGGGSTVTVTGTNFFAVSAVSFGLESGDDPVREFRRHEPGGDFARRVGHG